MGLNLLLISVLTINLYLYNTTKEQIGVSRFWQKQTSFEDEVDIYFHSNSEDCPLLEDAPPPGGTSSLHSHVAEHRVGLSGVARVPENGQTISDHKVNALRALGVLNGGTQAFSLEVADDRVQRLSLQKLVDCGSDTVGAGLTVHVALSWLVADGVAHPLRLWTKRVLDLT